MYYRVGRADVSALLDTANGLPIYWNPPGWGSANALPLWPSAVLAMVVGMKPGSYIPFHRDDPARENAKTVLLDRFHIVLATNPQCWNFHAGAWQQLEVGSIYQMDPTSEHASINLGATTRLHLVVDLDEKESRRLRASQDADLGELHPTAECGESA